MVRTGKVSGFLVLACIALIGFGSLSAVAAEDEDEPSPGTREPASIRIEYEPEITGVKDTDLRERLEAAAQLFALVDRPPATAAGLERRAREDLDRLRTTLRSEGYYAAVVEFALDAAARPVAVRIQVKPGAQYRLGVFTIRYAGAAEPEPAHRPALKDIGVKIGMPARGPAIKAAEGRVLAVLGDRGYPFPKIANMKASVRHDTARMTVELTVDSGLRARFGPLAITGLRGVEEDYIRRLVAWSEGAVYDRRKLDATREALRSTALFSSIRIATTDALDAEGLLPVTIDLAERPHRTIGAGVSYSTDIGPGGEVFWEHRNLFDRNEQLKLTTMATRVEQTGKAEFRKPAFLAGNQTLLTEASVANRDTDAFAQRSGIATIALERTYPSRWRAVLGVIGEYDWIDDNQGDREFQLAGLQVRASRRTTDNALDPTRGTTLELAATPYAGVGDEALRFARFVAGGSAYRAIDKGKRFVLAGRLRTGSIVGESTAALPADKRFYAGGGGSVRGYEFQEVGPLDGLGDPVGGRSLFEVSGELRIRVSEKFGVVPFVDGGTVFDDPYPAFNETLRWSAGLGLRYFTDFGPLRADVAFPINGRDGVDDRFELYISIGQAF
jgi:translocation and assembly module TamA